MKDLKSLDGLVVVKMLSYWSCVTKKVDGFRLSSCRRVLSKGRCNFDKCQVEMILYARILRRMSHDFVDSRDAPHGALMRLPFNCPLPLDRSFQILAVMGH